MSESLRITMGDGNEFEATPDNTTLYTFMGKTAIGNILLENSTVNHVYLQLSAEGEPNRGMYLFEQFHAEPYKTVAEYVIENDYPQLLNLRDVPQCDLAAHTAYADKEQEKFATDLPDFLPENFK